MSRLRTNIITNRMANGAPTVSNGLVISGVTTTSDIKVGTGATLNVYGGANFSGIVTATSFVGDGSGLTGAGPSLANGANNRVVTATGANALTGESGLLFTGTNLGIGNRTSSPDQLLHVHTSSGDAVIHVEAGADPKLRLRAHNGQSIVQFADASSSNPGEIVYDHASDYLKFHVNGSERLRIGSVGAFGLNGTNYGSAGQVLTSQGSGSAVTWSTVAAGGASNISFNSGNGIDFSATGDGTGSSSMSELLDDYETGEWTGSINSGSANINNPWYVKIGKLVIGGGNITAISDTSSSNPIIVNGLPFSNSGGNSGSGALAASKNNQFDKMCRCYVSGTTVRFMVSSLSTGSHDYLRHSSVVQSSGSITFGFNYQTS